MDILKFRVRGQALTLTNPNIKLIPVTDTVNQYLCQFEFSEDWDDLNKVVVFKNVSYNIIKEVYLSTSNECYIPWEVLSNSGEIFLEVIGTEVRGEVVTVRIPSTLLGFKWEIQEGLLDVSANISPTPDLFEQFVSSVRSDSIVAATARNEAVIARDVAVQSAADASASELAATSAAESAVNSASTASSAASSASESALSVAGVADETKSYAEIASAKAADASTQAEIAAGAKEDAVTAKAGAEAARDEAATSADLAQTTESHIKTMTVSAHSLAETEAPTVTKTDTSTGFALDFGIPKGATGPKGEDGDNIHYTWVKYADTPTSGMSDNPTGKAYIGIAYNKSTPVGSTVYSDYAWSRIKGEPGEDGYSPTVTTGTASDGSTTLTVTNKTGSTTTTLADGKARADINNLEVGGRNYVVKTASFSSTKNGITVDYDGDVYHIYGTNTKTDADYSITQFVNRTNVFEPGAVYTVSTTTPLPDGVYVGLNTRNTAGTEINAGSPIRAYLFGDGVKKSHTFTCASESNGLLVGFFGVEANCGTVDVTFKVKLEKGNKATDWTPAPEDVQAEIDNIEIGGRNLLLDSSFTDTNKWFLNGTDLASNVRLTHSADGGKIEVINTVTGPIVNAYKFVNYNNTYEFLSTEFKKCIQGGIWLTLSCDIKINFNTDGLDCLAFDFRTVDSTSQVRRLDLFFPNNMAKNTWVRVKTSVYIKEITDKTIGRNLMQIVVKSDAGRTAGSTVEYRNVKLEIGNKATDWTPAPEDKANAPVLLWTNASPTSEFAAQTISLALDNYDEVEIEFKHSSSASYKRIEKVKKGESSRSSIVTGSSTSGEYMAAVIRTANVTASGVTFGNGNLANQSSYKEGSSYMVPTKIYGIKGV